MKKEISLTREQITEITEEVTGLLLKKNQDYG